MKKILSLVLAMAMILSSFSFAFALPSDVVDTDYEGAVERLAALDILVGYEDGTFKPDNSITRAEFAAIAVRALGMEDIAKGSVANTKFVDVRETHWASGYVNLAVSKGIIVGYPDGTFKPEAPVSYSEAVAMLVRLLGYEPSIKSTEWPSNYLTKASEIGLTLGIKFNYNDSAKRGIVSILTDKALDIDLMDLTEVTSGDETWEITDDTLLTKYLNVEELEDAYVIETASHSLGDLDADEIIIRDEDGDSYTFDILETIDADALLGHEVTVFVKDTDDDGKLEEDDIVISLQNTTDERDVIAYDWIVSVESKNEDFDIPEDSDDDDVVIGLDDTDDEFDLADDAIVYYNYERVDALDRLASTKVGEGYVQLEEVAGKFILNDDDEIIFMDVVNYDLPVVVTDVQVDDERIKYFMYTDSESTLDLDGEDYQIFKDGEITNLEDIEIDDVLYFWEAESGEYVLSVYSDKVEGTLESIDSDNNMYWDYTLVVDGKDIYVGPAFTISTDEGETINSLAAEPKDYDWEADTDRLSDLEAMVGEQVVVYLNKYNVEGDMQARHITSAVESGSEDYYIVSEEPWSSRTSGYKYYIELIDENDDDVTYELSEDETEFTFGEYDDEEFDLSISQGKEVVIGEAENGDEENITDILSAGTLVDVDFSSDGTISSIEVIDEDSDDVAYELEADDSNVDDDYDRIKIDGDTYYVSDETIFFGVDKRGTKIEDVKAYTWDDIADIQTSGEGKIELLARVDDSELEAVVVTYDGEDTELISIGENDYGYVLKREIKSDGLWVHMAVEDEVRVLYAGDLSKSTQNKLQEKVLAKIKLSGDELDSATTVDRNVFYTKADGIKSEGAFEAITYVNTSTGSGIKARISVDRLYDDDDNLIATFEYDEDEDEGTFIFEAGYDKNNVEFGFDKLEIVSGGVDSKNGVIEVMAVGADEDKDETWFVDVDKNGEDSFFYDVDTSHRVLEDKILSLEDLSDGDMLHIYDVPGESITEYIAIYDR